MINKLLYYLFKFFCWLFPQQILKRVFDEYHQKWDNERYEDILFQEQLERDRKKAIEQSFREWLLEEAAIGKDYIADANSRDLSVPFPLGYSQNGDPVPSKTLDPEKFWGKK